MIKNLLKLFTISCILIFSSDSFAQFSTQLPAANTTTTTRCPVRANQKFFVGLHQYNQNEIGAGLNGATIDSISFTATTSPVIGTKRGYLEVYYKFVTSDTITYNKIDTFNTVISTFTQIFADSVKLPNAALDVNIPFTSPILLNGQNILLAYRWSQPGTVTGAPNPTYQAYSNVAAPRTCITAVSQTAMPITFNVPTSNTFTTFRPAVKWHYRFNGVDVRIVDLRVDGQLLPNNNYPVKIRIANFGTTNAPTGGKLTITDGTQTFIDSGLANINSLTEFTYTFNNGNFNPLIGDKSYKIKAYLNTYAGDLNLTNDTLSRNYYVFDSTSVLTENFNDTAVFKNSAALALQTGPSGWITINNSIGGAGAIGPWFTQFQSPLPVTFDGSQYVAQNFQGATATVNADKWLISPIVLMDSCPSAIDSLTFYTIKASAAFADSIEVLLSPTGGNTVGDFTVSLGNINASVGNWGRNVYALSAPTISPGNAYRVAFRYKGPQPSLSFAAIDAVSIRRNAPKAQLTLNFISPLNYCANDTNTYYISASSTTPGAIISWISPLGSVIADSVDIQPSSAPSANISFTVSANATGFCSAYSAIQNVNVFTPPATPTITVSPSIITPVIGSANQAITITVSSVTLPYIYTTIPSGVATSTLGNGLTNALILTDSVNGSSIGNGSVVYSCFSVDTNGCFSAIVKDSVTVTIVTSITNNSLDAELQIAPNPASDVLNITLSDSTYEVVLIDSKGSIMIDRKNQTNKTQLDVSNLTSGNYYLHIKSNGITSIKKVFINR